MAAGNRQNQCVTCDKRKAIYQCLGCSRTFCSQHSNEHGQELNRQLDQIDADRKLLQETLDQERTNS